MRIAGLTVAIVAPPLAVAPGVASGASPDKGLITAIVAGLMISLLGGLRVRIAIFLLLFVLFAGNLMAYVPMAVLAAILLMVAWGMSEVGRFILLMRVPAGERAVLLLTFMLTVFVDLMVAITVGATLASLLFVARMRETVTLTAASADEEDPGQRNRLPADVEVFHITGPLFFGVAGELLDALKRIGRKPRAIILRLELVPILDASGAAALAESVAETPGAGDRVRSTSRAPKPEWPFDRRHNGAADRLGLPLKSFP
jgi:SulP family sulfate permease